MEGGSWLSRYGAGEQDLLSVCAFQQASCPLGLLLFPLEFSPQEDHSTRQKTLTSPTMSAKTGNSSRKRGCSNGQIHDLRSLENTDLSQTSLWLSWAEGPSLRLLTAWEPVA